MNLRRWSKNWLLWLALLLPVAQAMAGVHALSHVSGDRQDDRIAHLVHCDLCLAAADLASGAPAGEPGPLLQSVAVHSLAATPLAPVVEQAPAWLPPARAPPASA